MVWCCDDVINPPSIARRSKPALAFMMKMDAKLDDILDLLREEDGEEEEGTDT